MTEEEIDGLEVGDVFLYGQRKTPRIVRGIVNPPSRSPFSPSRVYMVMVAIKKCSWTGRCHTYVDRYFLRTQCETTEVHFELDSPEDIEFEAEQDRLARGEWIPEFTCCDAKRELPA